MGLLGSRVKRTEDPGLLTGVGEFVADIAAADALHAVFVRSVEPHGTIEAIHVDDARSAEGVVAVFTADDLALEPVAPSFPLVNQAVTRTALARGRVRYVGEPVAVVLAHSYAAAVDATELVWAEIDPLPALVGIDAARGDEVLLHPDAGTNCCVTLGEENDPDFFAGCDVVVQLAFDNTRVSVAPIEPRAAIAHWQEVEGRMRLTQWSSTQFPHRTKEALTAACGVEADQVRVITPEVGGGFGAKNGSYPEDIVVALAARHLDQPVRWAETRSESMLNLAHGRDLRITATLGGDHDGGFSHFRLHIDQDAGAYAMVGAILPMIAHWVATGVYDIANIELSAASYLTTTTPVGAYRGAGRPEATHALERIVDRFAAEVGMDPIDVRRRNFIAPEAFPFTTPTDQVYDSGEYEKALDAVLAALDVVELRAEQQRRRDHGSASLLGIGFSAYVEIANPIRAGEFGSVTINPDGSALVLTGSSAHGQGHHTTFAQIVSDVLGLPLDKIEVRHGDTDEVDRGGGTGGSRSLQTGGIAVHQAGEAVVDLAKEVVAELLEANPADIVHDVDRGEFSVAGTPTASVGWERLAADAADMGTRLEAEVDFQPPGATFPFGVHASVVEIDRDTGEVTILRHVACDDAGVIVNPMIVDGQVHGGIASGVAQALMEEFRYSDDGTPLTSNFMDYGILSAAELPMFERLEQETPTGVNPLGVKGVGEAGTIGSMPAVQNAAVDALAHLGVTHLEIPLTSQRVWQAMTEVSG